MLDIPLLNARFCSWTNHFSSCDMLKYGSDSLHHLLLDSFISSVCKTEQINNDFLSAVCTAQGHPTDRFGKLSVRKAFNRL